MKLHVFESSGERTFSSDKENIYHPKFAWYAERSSLAGINPRSYHLIGFELVNPSLYNYFPSFEYRIFFERSEVKVAVVWLRCDFVTLLILLRVPGDSRGIAKYHFYQYVSYY